MLSKLVRSHKTHSIHHIVKTLNGATQTQLIFLGVQQPTSGMIAIPHRLFSSSSSSTSSADESDLEVMET